MDKKLLDKLNSLEIVDFDFYCGEVVYIHCKNDDRNSYILNYLEENVGYGLVELVEEDDGVLEISNLAFSIAELFKDGKFY